MLNIVFELDRQKVKNLKEKENTIVSRGIQGFGLQFTSPVTGVFCSYLQRPQEQKPEMGYNSQRFFQIFMCLKHGLSYRG